MIFLSIGRYDDCGYVGWVCRVDACDLNKRNRGKRNKGKNREEYIKILFVYIT